MFLGISGVDNLFFYRTSCQWHVSTGLVRNVRSSPKGLPWAHTGKHNGFHKFQIQSVLPPNNEHSWFYGDPLEWSNFWRKFVTIIHKNTDLDDNQKFNISKGTSTILAAEYVSDEIMTALLITAQVYVSSQKVSFITNKLTHKLLLHVTDDSQPQGNP